jgi:hypothetical protein
MTPVSLWNISQARRKTRTGVGMSEQTPHLEILSRNRINRSTIIVTIIPVSVGSLLAAIALWPFLAWIAYGLLAVLSGCVLFLAALALIEVRRRWIHAHIIHLSEHGVVDALGWRMLPLMLPQPHVSVSEAGRDTRDLEKEIRDLAAGGRSYRDIAKDLGISFYQVQKIMSK